MDIKSRPAIYDKFSPFAFLFVIASLWVPADNNLQIIRYGTYGLLLILFIVHTRASYAHIAAKLPLAPFFAFVAISFAWSTHSIEGFVSLLLLFITVVGSVTIAMSIPNGVLLRSVGWAVVSFVIAGAAVAILLPSLGTEQTWLHYGQWNGLSRQKNGFGLHCAIAIVFLYWKIVFDHKSSDLINISIIILLAVTSYSLMMSGSRSALLIACTGIVFITLYRFQTLSRITIFRLLAFFTLSFIAISAFNISIYDKYIYLYGIEINTSSRVLIWDYGLRSLEPIEYIFGTGVSSFWTEDEQFRFSNLFGWVIPNFHNGYISAFIETGLIGLSLLTFGLFSTIRIMAKAKSKFTLFYMAIFVMMIIFNIFENSYMRSTDFGLVMLILSHTIMHFKNTS